MTIDHYRDSIKIAAGDFIGNEFYTLILAARLASNDDQGKPLDSLLSREHKLERRDALNLAKKPFPTLIMAAARFADTSNFSYLSSAYPDIMLELKQRYSAPGGRLPTD